MVNHKAYLAIRPSEREAITHELSLSPVVRRVAMERAERAALVRERADGGAGFFFSVGASRAVRH